MTNSTQVQYVTQSLSPNNLQRGLRTIKFQSGVDTTPKQRLVAMKDRGEVNIAKDGKWATLRTGTYTDLLREYDAQRNDNTFEILAFDEAAPLNLMPYFDIEFYHSTEARFSFHTDLRRALVAFCEEKWQTAPKVYVLDSFNAEKAKVSFHVVIRGCGYCKGIAECRQFALNFLGWLEKQSGFSKIKSQPNQHNEAGSPIDLAVYGSKSQLMRLPYKSKPGSAAKLQFITKKNKIVPWSKIESRRDYLLKGFITYTGKEAHLDTTKLEEIQAPTANRTHSGVSGSWDSIDAVINCEGATSPKEEADTIEFYLSCIPSRTQGYNAWAYLAMACKNADPDSFPVFDEWSSTHSTYDKVECRKMWEGLERREEGGYNLATLRRIAKKCSPQAFSDPKPEPVPQTNNEIRINSKYLMDSLSIDQVEKYRCIELHSMMNTGKSYFIRQFLKSRVNSSILFLTSRRSYARNLKQEVRPYLPNVKLYLEEDRGRLNEFDHLIVELESLHFVNRTFDYVILDESESLLSIFSQSTLKYKNTTFDLLDSILRSSKGVILADAFFSRRSADFSREFFDKNEIVRVTNEYLPPARQLVRVQEYSKFETALKNKLKAGKRCVFVCSSRKKADELHQEVKKNTKVKYYYGGNDDEKNRKLDNVNEEWADCQLLLYTPTITNGVNFTVADHFDYLFVYGSSFSCHARDVFQAAYRVRSFKEPIVYVNTIARPPPGLLPLDRATVRNDVERDLKKQYKGDQHKYKVDVLVQNALEANRSKARFDSEFDRFCALVNWVPKKKAVDNCEQPNEEAAPDYDVADLAITYDIYECLKRWINQETCPALGKLQVQYYQLFRNFDRQVVVDEDEELIRYVCPAKELIDAMFEDYRSGRNHDRIIQVRMEKTFGHLDDPEPSMIDFANYNDEIFMSDIPANYILVRKVCRILGMENSHAQPTKISEENKPAIMKEIAEIKPEIMRVFPIRDRSTKWDWNSCLRFINSVLSTWGFSKIECQKKRVRCGSELKYIYNYSAAESGALIWSDIKPYVFLYEDMEPF